MAYEIKIYGDIIAQHQKDEGVKGFTLSDLQAQLSKAGGEDVKVRFNSRGGDFNEGFAMYDELRRYATENNARIHTYAEANLASIVTIPFLAGDTREISRHIEPFVHNAWNEATGDSRTMFENAEQLEKCNDKLARHYAEHTELSYDEARELMNAETSISTREALRMRFANKIENVYRPVALKRFTKTTNNMSKENKGIMAKIKAIFSDVQNKIVKDAEQRDVDFYELEDDEPIEVGANATIDGAPAEGEVVMANGETYVFADGVLTEIRPVENEQDEEKDEQPSDLEQALAQVAELKEQLATTQAALEQKSILAKDRLKAINNFKKLEGEIVVQTPPARPTQTPAKAVAKGSRAAAAISNLKTNNSK